MTACSDSGTVAAGDVFRVEIEACAGVSHQRATAMAVGPDLVATAAHTFETARSALVRAVDGGEIAAEVVYLDLDSDVALLSVDAAPLRIFALTAADDGAEVTIPTYADADGVEIKQATVLRSVSATLDGEGRRQAVELSASIDPGDSGAPVVDADGRAVGMVFASSRRDDRGWAVAAAELEAAIAAVADEGHEPPPSRCRS
ncbi:MAG: serine protease [Acidimicrobiia bacterium]|nr:serine protease [Acidimicrobiia bacterium]